MAKPPPVNESHKAGGPLSLKTVTSIAFWPGWSSLATSRTNGFFQLPDGALGNGTGILLMVTVHFLKVESDNVALEGAAFRIKPWRDLASRSKTRRVPRLGGD